MRFTSFWHLFFEFGNATPSQPDRPTASPINHMVALALTRATPRHAGGQEATSGRCVLISEEWELCTPEEMAEGDPAQYSVMTNASYGLPTVWPMGDYH